jgi:hypothetical protein
MDDGGEAREGALVTVPVRHGEQGDVQLPAPRVPGGETTPMQPPQKNAHPETHVARTRSEKQSGCGTHEERRSYTPISPPTPPPNLPPSTHKQQSDTVTRNHGKGVHKTLHIHADGAGAFVQDGELGSVCGERQTHQRSWRTHTSTCRRGGTHTCTCTYAYACTCTCTPTEQRHRGGSHVR